MSRQAYLADLQARHQRNRQVVESHFLPLDEATRGWQPEPTEWSVDQCFQHLVIAFDWLSPNFIPALNIPESAGADGLFRPSWPARRFFDKQFDPKMNGKTMGARNPKQASCPEALSRWLAQHDRLSAMIKQAAGSDLQTMCRIIKWLPLRYNLGDYLNFYVLHDALHIDQAQRVLAVYGTGVHLAHSQ